MVWTGPKFEYDQLFITEEKVIELGVLVMLNQRGQEGWQLVQASGNLGRWTFTFIRQLPPEKGGD